MFHSLSVSVRASCVVAAKSFVLAAANVWGRQSATLPKQQRCGVSKEPSCAPLVAVCRYIHMYDTVQVVGSITVRDFLCTHHCTLHHCTVRLESVGGSCFFNNDCTLEWDLCRNGYTHSSF